MKNKFSQTYFYLSSIIFYTCLPAFPLSAAIEQANQAGSSQPPNTSIVNSIDGTENNDQEEGLPEKILDDKAKQKLFEEVKNGNVKNVDELFEMYKDVVSARDEDEKTPFLCAAKQGQVKIAKLLWQRGANIRAKDKDGNNALHLACLYSSSISMIIWLLDECHIGIETQGRYQQTPFFCAAQKGQLEIAKLLKERDANLNAKDKDGNSALHLACHSSDVPMIAWLLDECHMLIEAKGKCQRTPFLCAVGGDQVEIAKLLRKRGANINAKDKDGDNALHYACFASGNVTMVTWLLDECKIGLETKGQYEKTSFLFTTEKGRLEIAKLLIQRGANLNAKDKDGNNALHWACFKGNVPMTTWLLDKCKIGLETKGSGQKTPFMCAAQKGHLELAKLLRKRRVNINAKSKSGNNALHLACLFSDSIPIVTWLLDVCKLGIETKGYAERTPFLCAAERGQVKIAKLLRERGANINAKSKSENGALHYACLFSDSAPMLTWLLDVCHIPIEVKGKYQSTPFLCAAEKGQLKIAKLLRERGANINARNAYRNNALHLACTISGSVPMTTWLLDVCKISIETKGYAQKTPFLCTAQKGRLEMAKLLKDRGANIHAKNEFGNNALHYACLFSGSIPMTTWLLDVCKMHIEAKGQNQKTPFLYAAEKGQLEIAKLLRKRGTNLNATNNFENNALHLACLFSGSIPMTNWLLDVCKISIETKAQYQRTPFLCAAEKGQVKIAKLLRQRGANINAKDKDGNNALHLACLSSGSIPMTTWLLDVCKTLIEEKGQYQRTPFFCAAEKGRLEIAKLLKSRGANIKTTDEFGNNALHAACTISGSVPMVTWLLDLCKLGIETKGNAQRTPFLCAAEKGQAKIAKLLKERNANIHAKDKDGNNALHLTCLFSGSVPMVTWLLDVCKLGLETKGNAERTPFLCAAEKGQVKIAKLLRERGAHIYAKDKDGNNALHLAKEYSNNKEMIRYLQSLDHL